MSTANKIKGRGQFTIHLDGVDPRLLKEMQEKLVLGLAFAGYSPHLDDDGNVCWAADLEDSLIITARYDQGKSPVSEP